VIPSVAEAAGHLALLGVVFRSCTFSCASIIGISFLYTVFGSCAHLSGHRKPVQSVLIAFLTIARHLVPLAWLAAAWYAETAEMRLMTGFFLVSAPRTSWFQTMLYLLLRPAFFVDSQWHESMNVVSWGPIALMALNMLHSLSHREISSVLVEKKAPVYKDYTKEDVHVLQDVFCVREELQLVQPCTIVHKTSHRGKLYLSTTHLCFHGSSTGPCSLQFTVPLSNLTDIRFESHQGDGDTIVVLKNAIHVGGQGGEALTELVIRDCQEGVNALHERLSTAEIEDSEPDDSDDEPGSMPPPAPSSALSAFFPEDDQPFEKVLEECIPKLPFNDIAKDLLAPEFEEGRLLYDFYKFSDMTEMDASPWIDESDGDLIMKVRELTMVAKVPPAPMCPPTTRVTISVRVSSFTSGGQRASVLESSTLSHDVPFGTHFSVQERVEFRPNAKGTSTWVVKSTRVHFLKRVGWIKGNIEKTATNEQKKAGEKLIKCMRERSKARGTQSFMPPGDSMESRDDEKKREEVVWQLQRRTTIFQFDWRAPFLPHDGPKRCGWVDTAYNRHLWMPPGHSQNTKDMPPLIEDDSFKEIEKWHVNKQLLTADAEGWQYAVDFYRKDSLWSATSSGNSVRRRLWTATYAVNGAGLEDEALMARPSARLTQSMR